jgi:hypothetical protein
MMVPRAVRAQLVIIGFWAISVRLATTAEQASLLRYGLSLRAIKLESSLQ